MKSKILNLDTKSTNHDDYTHTNEKWVRPPSQSVVINNFNKFQMTILKMFTETKNKLSELYKKIIEEIGRINKVLSREKYKMDTKFMYTL